MESKALKTSEVVMQNQTPILMHVDTKSPNYRKNYLGSFKQTPLSTT